MLGLNPTLGKTECSETGKRNASFNPQSTCRRGGCDIVGPLPPDTAFTEGQRRQTDAYACMYHDQGLIPVKAIAFESAVNATLGLPIVAPGGSWHRV